jgi:branched-chain amino acid transport system permease protein
MLPQVLFSGLALGSIYGLVALGFALVFKATEVLNFAQGMFVVVGAYLALTGGTLLQLPFGLTLPFMVVGAALIGAAIQAVLIRPLTGKPMLSIVMVTIMLSTVLRAVIEIIYGPQPRVLATPLPAGAYLVAGVRVSQLHLLAAGVCWTCLALFGLFFRYTSFGLQMRATANGHEAALVSGINVDLVTRVAWAIGSVLAAIGGLFLGQLQLVSTELESAGLLALPAVVIGGLQSIPGAIIGGLLVGLIEQISGSYVSPRAADIFIYLLLLLVLMVRPWGLFGQRELGRV